MSVSASLHVQWHHGSYCNEAGRSSRHGSIRIHFRTQMWPHNVAVIKTSTAFMFSVNTWKTSRKIRIFFYHIFVFCIFSVRMMLCSQVSSLCNLKITSWLMRTVSFTSDLKQLILCMSKMVCRGVGTKTRKTLLLKAFFLGVLLLWKWRILIFHLLFLPIWSFLKSRRTGDGGGETPP